MGSEVKTNITTKKIIRRNAKGIKIRTHKSNRKETVQRYEIVANSSVNLG